MPYLVTAVPITRLRSFPGWPGDDLPDDAVVFVHPDASVRRSSLPDARAEPPLLEGETDSFRAFCREQLGLDARP